MSGTVLSLAPRCGTSPRHLVLGYHIGLESDAATPFQPGRFEFDFGIAQRVFSAADVQPAAR